MGWHEDMLPVIADDQMCLESEIPCHGIGRTGMASDGNGGEEVNAIGIG